MSTAFTYGGIERSVFEWSEQGEFLRDGDHYSNPDKNIDLLEQNSLTSKEAYIDGGRDRSEIKWVRADDR